MSSPKSKGAQRQAPTTTSAKRTPLRILCFGDSLTSGYPTGMPYAIQLRLKLAAAFPHHEISCDVEGVPGDQVAKGKFDERLVASWRLAQRDKQPYDWTIILGGTKYVPSPSNHTVFLPLHYRIQTANQLPFPSIVTWVGARRLLRSKRPLKSAGISAY